MLEVAGVGKSFGDVQAVKGISFQVPPGKILGLVGPNGAGKTTTMRMILNIIGPDRGRVLWQGRPVTLGVSRTFGYLPEERGLYPRMTVREELRFFAQLHGVADGRQLDREIERWIDRVALTEHASKRVDELSKGNAQKVQFLVSLLHRPPLLVLDEPFAGLDPVNVRILKDVVRELAAGGTTVVFSSHRMDHVEELCDLVCLIDRGELRLEGTVDEVRQSTGEHLLRLEVPGHEEQVFSLFPELQVTHRGTYWEARIPRDFPTRRVLEEALRLGEVRRFEVAPPSLEDIYVHTVGRVD
ncbi:MAG: ATP-binding cassette domain-containing protein [Bacillota bacterium]|nr:ATP-binding cassette domain-containing protein [Bacillota bacterium]